MLSLRLRAKCSRPSTCSMRSRPSTPATGKSSSSCKKPKVKSRSGSRSWRGVEGGPRLRGVQQPRLWTAADAPHSSLGNGDPDQDARTTKEQAEHILKSVNAPIALEPLFVPGVRRGYAILPIDERLGESFESRRQRVQEVIAKVRAANVQLGTHDDGGNRRIWIAMSAVRLAWQPR